MTKSEAARLNGKKGGRPKKCPMNAETSADRAHVAAADAPKPEKPTETQEPTETHAVTPELVQAVAENPYGLSPKEMLFVEAFCGAANFNATEAYRLAGFEASPRTIRAHASRLGSKSNVSAAIAVKLAAKVQRLQVADDAEVLARVTMRARGDIRKLFSEDDPLAKLPDDVAATVKAITPTRYGRRIELYDAHRDDELLLKVSGKLTQRHEVKVTRALEDILEEAHQLHQAKQIEGTAA